MKKIFSWFFSSFDTKTTGGLSARKATAFTLVACVIFLHWKYASNETATTFLMYDLAAIFLMLGIVTVDQLIKFKNGSSAIENKPTDQA